jgi:hypothetical protein
MIEIGVFHNGASDLPVTRTTSGVAINDGNLAEVHEASQRGLVAQVRQGILADKLGFNYFFMTEHHFQPEGAEFSPNPLLSSPRPRSRRARARFGWGRPPTSLHGGIRFESRSRPRCST